MLHYTEVTKSDGLPENYKWRIAENNGQGERVIGYVQYDGHLPYYVPNVLNCVELSLTNLDLIASFLEELMKLEGNKMKLTRNLTADGTCKYALIRLDKLRQAGITMDTLKADLKDVHLVQPIPEIPSSEWPAVTLGDMVEFGEVGTPDEFLVIKVKDVNAPYGLFAYAEAAGATDRELQSEVLDIVARSKACAVKKLPD